MILLAAGLVSASFVGPLRDAAFFFWVAALVLVLGALAVAVRSGRARPAGKVAPTVALVAVAVAFAVAAVGAVQVAALPDDVPTSLAFEVPAGPGVVQVAHREADLSDAALEPVVTEAAETAAELSEVGGAQRDTLVEAVRGLGYLPLSGLTADYAAASAYDYQGSTVVSVPLRGTDLPEVSNVTFVSVDGLTSVVEMKSWMIDAATVGFQMWQDGTQSKNVVLTNPDADSAGGFQQIGVDWRKLNSCLNSIGISWAVLAVISVACAAACATMVLCAPCIAAMAGWTGGTIAACVKRAWV